MKTKFLSVAVASLLCVSLAQARWYFGFDGGYTGGSNDSRTTLDWSKKYIF